MRLATCDREPAISDAVVTEADPRITSGPDNALWFTNVDGTIGRIATDGTITGFDGPGIDEPYAITTGSDGALWFVNTGNDSIGRITTAGVVSNYTDPGVHVPIGITTGLDGNVWFTNAGGDSIGRITPAGVITTFTSTGISLPHGITTAPNGDLWFTNRGNQSIGRITPAGAVSNFTDPSISDPFSIATASDGTMVFINRGNSSVGRVTSAGVVSTLAPNVAFSGIGITSGPDGNVWLTTSVDTIVRVTLAGVATTFHGEMHYPYGITVGPDGNLWFGNTGTDSIGRMSTAGVETTFYRIRQPEAIAPGLDGSYWFINDSFDYGRGSIGRIASDGKVSNFPAIDVGSGGTLTAGPDGNEWFTTNQNNSVGRITPDGTIATFTDPSIQRPMGITSGPDGNLWFTNYQDSVGRITPSGVVSNFTGPGISGSVRIVVGPDGALWFTNWAGSSIGRITTAGEVSNFAGPNISSPWGITPGPDGALWFVNTGNHTIGRITTAGTTSSFVSQTIKGQGEITAGADGALWFTNPDGGSIGRISVGGAISNYATADTDHPRGIVAGPGGAMWFTNRTNSISQIASLGIPLSPSAVLATPGNAQVVVSWTEPALTGGTITGYTVTASPGGQSCTWTTGPLSCVVTGLTNGQAYTFTVTATNSSGTSAPSNPSSSVVPFTVPDAPAAPIAVADGAVNGRSNVSWSPPLFNGGAVVTNYVVTASPGGATRTVTGTSVTFDGLLNGTVYTFAVQAQNAAGLSPPSSPSNSVTPIGPGGTFHSLSPVRVLDSRDGTGGYTTPWSAGQPRDLQITGRAGVPATAGSVVLNVTITGATAASHVSLWPTGADQPTASNLNFLQGQTIANLSVTKIGQQGTISIFNNAGNVDVVADIVGYFDDGSDPSGFRYTSVGPSRILDSRDGTGGYTSPWGPGNTRVLAVRGINPVPTSAAAVVVNVTITGSSTPSHLTVFPGGETPPLASSLNFAAGETRANLVMVKLGADGTIAIRNNAGSVNVIADVVGYYGFGSGGREYSLTPTRLLDSRNGTGGYTTPWGPAESRGVAIRGPAGIPSNARAVILNVTATGATSASHLTVWPTGVMVPTASNLNFGAGQTVPNLVIVQLGADGAINIRNNAGNVHVIADITGYLT